MLALAPAEAAGTRSALASADLTVADCLRQTPMGAAAAVRSSIACFASAAIAY